MRMLFMSSLIYFEKIDEIKNYRDVFSRRDNCVFDEWPRDRVNINILAEQKKIRCCYEEKIFLYMGTMEVFIHYRGKERV